MKNLNEVSKLIEKTRKEIYHSPGPFKKFEIWSEGFIATGEQATATYHGTIMANSFKEACRYMFYKRTDFDSKRLTLWGCRLYDNEMNARRTYG